MCQDADGTTMHMDPDDPEDDGPDAFEGWTIDLLLAVFPPDGPAGPIWKNCRPPAGPWWHEPEPIELPKALARFPYDATRYAPYRDDGVHPVPLGVYQRFEQRIFEGRKPKRAQKILGVFSPCNPGRRVPLRRSDPWVHWQAPSPEVWEAYAAKTPKTRHRLRADAMPRVRQYRKVPPEPNARAFDAPEWSALFVSAVGSNGADRVAGLVRELLYPYSMAPNHRLLLDAADQGDVSISQEQRVWEAFEADAENAETFSHTGPSAAVIHF